MRPASPRRTAITPSMSADENMEAATAAGAQPTHTIALTGSQGFHLRFDNGWTVSVQLGPYNYCSNRAEVSAWDEDCKWFQFKDGDTVRGYLTADQVARFISKVRKFEVAA